VGKSNVSTTPTGIDATSLTALQHQQIILEGVVDASAAYLHGARVNGAVRNVLFVTTAYGKTIAVNADDGAVLWTHTPMGFAAWDGSRQITNTTPTADPGREFIYTSSPDGHVEKLAVADGHSVWSTAITRLPQREKMGSPVTYFRGHLIAVTDGYIGDANPYQGHVAILDAASGRLLQVWNSLCSDRQEMLDPSSCPQSRSAIWGRAGAVIDETTGNIFVATGNGPWDGNTAWGDAVLELDPDAKTLIGNYTPTNNEELNARDADVGSTSPALLGGGYVAQGGKDGTIRVLTLDMMRGSAPHRGGELQVVSTPSGNRLFTALAVMHAGASTWVFAADGGATAAWTFGGGRLQPAWKNSTPGTSPLVAGGLLYVYNPAGSLHVYDPTTGKEIANLQCGPGHWNSPIVVDGRIVLPEGNANRPGQGVLNIWRVTKKAS
jgi:outer membrane protein assembly factor BamB